MAFTAFGASQNAVNFKRAWVSETIKAFRQQSFWEKFVGTTANSIVHRITELKKTEKGDRAMIGLKANLKASGIVGDNDIDGRREAIETYWVEVHTDQLRKSVCSKGRVDDQQPDHVDDLDWACPSRQVAVFGPRADAAASFIAAAASSRQRANGPKGISG